MSVFFEISENDFKTTLLNKSEVEQILGTKISFNNQTKLKDDMAYLPDYAMYADLALHDVVCLFLEIDPQYINATDNPRYEVIYKAIEQLALTNKIQAKIERGKIYLSHDTAKQLANAYGLEWNVPPFKTLEPLSTTDHSELLQQLTAKDEEIARLKAEIEQLKQGQEKADIVDYKQCSIYGHYSENIEIIFRLSKQIAEKCDIDNPHSYPEKKHIAEYVKTYHSDNGSLSDAIYKIITPEKVKNKGRPPKEVETFQGFF